MKIGTIVNKMPIQRLSRGSPLLKDCDTLLGIEVEVENSAKMWDMNAVQAGYWTSKEDHSLRNSGRELVFTEPLFGADAVAAIEFLTVNATKLKWAISERTGLHVHMDVRNMELDKFRNLLIFYSLMEPLIYNWVGDRRHENLFCLPWYSADVDLEIVSNILYRADKVPESAREVFGGVRKYSGLNLAAVNNFGTVEFRHLKTTFNSQRIIDWVNIILSLKIAANAHTGSPSDILKQGKAIGPRGLAQRVFGYELVNKMWYPGYLLDYVGKGVVTAEWFLENPMELFQKTNPGKNIYEYMLAKAKVDVAKAAKSKKTEEHPGLVKYKAKAAGMKPKPQATNKKKPKTYAQIVDDIMIVNGTGFAGQAANVAPQFGQAIAPGTIHQAPPEPQWANFHIDADQQEEQG